MSLVQPLYFPEKASPTFYITFLSDLRGEPNSLYYIFVLLCALHVILENKKKSFLQLILLFSAHTSEKKHG